MPTVIAHHDVKDTEHWLASPKREEFFGPLGVTNIRTFVDPQNPTHVSVLMDVPDMDAVMAAMQTRGRRRGDGPRRRRAREPGAPHRGVALTPVRACRGGGAGVRPWRRITSPIAARSGGPPRAAANTSPISRK